MRAQRALRAAVAVAVLTGLLAGCGGTPDPSPSATQLPSGITATLVQLRADVSVREAQVQIRNGAEDALRIGAVQLEDPRFDGIGRRVVEGESEVASGRTVDVRVQLPAMDCDAPDEATTLLEVEFGVGASESVARFEIADTLDFLPALHRRECLAGSLADAAAVSLTTFAPSLPGQPATVQLEVDPTGEGAARIDRVLPTPLLMHALGGPAAPHPIGLDIAPDTGRTTVAIPLVPQRCDPHVIQEDKRGTVFTLDVTVEGVSGQVEVAADDDMKGRMLSWVAQWCGLGAG